MRILPCWFRLSAGGKAEMPRPAARRSPASRLGSRWRRPLALLLGFWLLIAAVVAGAEAAVASPGLCIGPVCADEIARSAKHHWQLRLRLADQAGQRERITIDCRDGRLSPESGRIDRAYASALARKACRL